MVKSISKFHLSWHIKINWKNIFHVEIVMEKSRDCWPLKDGYQKNNSKEECGIYWEYQWMFVSITLNSRTLLMSNQRETNCSAKEFDLLFHNRLLNIKNALIRNDLFVLASISTNLSGKSTMKLENISGVMSFYSPQCDFQIKSSINWAKKISKGICYTHTIKELSSMHRLLSIKIWPLIKIFDTSRFVMVSNLQNTHFIILW